MSNPTREEVLASIIANSDQLNADDLIAGPVTVTISGVRKGDKEQPIYVDLKEYPGKSFRPCKTVRRVLIALWSDDPQEWINQRITLYRDAGVKYGGVSVGGIRVSHASGISEPKTLLLTQTRGKKAEVVIHPIAETLSDEDKQMIEAFRADIANADTQEVLKSTGFILKQSPKVIQDAVRGDYAKRQKELEGK